jgi:hypothetical protein
MAVVAATACVTANAWRGVGGSTLVMNAPYVSAIGSGRYLVHFEETSVTTDPSGIDVYVDTKSGKCERAAME